jgi:hypothetical protein
MNRSTMFFGGIIVAIIAAILAIYYALPGVYHVLVSGKTPPLSPQPGHILLFAVIAVLAILVAVVNRPKAARR